jgi:hypothetical protein
LSGRADTFMGIESGVVTLAWGMASPLVRWATMRDDEVVDTDAGVNPQRHCGDGLLLLISRAPSTLRWRVGSC